MGFGGKTAEELRVQGGIRLLPGDKWGRGGIAVQELDEGGVLVPFAEESIEMHGMLQMFQRIPGDFAVGGDAVKREIRAPAEALFHLVRTDIQGDEGGGKNDRQEGGKARAVTVQAAHGERQEKGDDGEVEKEAGEGKLAHEEGLIAGIEGAEAERPGQPGGLDRGFQQVQNPEEEVRAEGKDGRRDRRGGQGGTEQVQRHEGTALEDEAEVIDGQLRGIHPAVEGNDEGIEQRQQRGHAQYGHRRQVFAQHDPGQGDRAREEQLVGFFLLFFRQKAHGENRTEEHPQVAHFPDKGRKVAAALAEDGQIEEHGGNREENAEIDIADSRAEIALHLPLPDGAHSVPSFSENSTPEP